LNEKIIKQYADNDTIIYQNYADVLIENFYLRQQDNILQVWDSTINDGDIILARSTGERSILKNMNGLRY